MCMNCISTRILWLKKHKPRKYPLDINLVDTDVVEETLEDTAGDEACRTLTNL